VASVICVGMGSLCWCGGIRSLVWSGATEFLRNSCRILHVLLVLVHS
jgi:hypothetical protein